MIVGFPCAMQWPEGVTYPGVRLPCQPETASLRHRRSSDTDWPSPFPLYSVYKVRKGVVDMLDARGETLRRDDKVVWADTGDQAGTVTGSVSTEKGWFAEVQPADTVLGRPLPHLVQPHRLIKT